MSKDCNKFALEELVSIKEHIIAVPSASGTDNTHAKISENKLKRLNVITSNIRFGLELGKLRVRSPHLVRSEVDEPKCTNGWDGERNTVCPLSSDLGVWWVTSSMVEDQKGNNQNDLVGELAPTLHQESAGNLSTTVKTIESGRNLARSYSILHT